VLSLTKLRKHYEHLNESFVERGLPFSFWSVSIGLQNTSEQNETSECIIENLRIVLYLFTGLTYPLQRDIYLQILEGTFQIVVTTSVAEEGFDLPVPDLVIQMDPSSSVSALVQIRGRAPLNEARVVAICRNDEQAKKIEDLLKREENMRRSARLINGL